MSWLIGRTHTRGRTDIRGVGQAEARMVGLDHRQNAGIGHLDAPAPTLASPLDLDARSVPLGNDQAGEAEA